MTTHRYHPDTEQGDPVWTDHDGTPLDVAILYDDCDRCAEHAVQPWGSLDDRHLLRLRGIIEGIIDPVTKVERLAANALREHEEST